MKVAMMQPTFMPWQGVFELIFHSNCFIFLDDFQFSVQSYHQRNRLFVNKGQVDWYSVPVSKSNSFKAPLNETRINEAIPWRKKFWKRIEQNYRKTSFYPELAPVIKEWLKTQSSSLAGQNVSFILKVCDILGIDREFRYSSCLSSPAERSMRVLELLKWCKADQYLSAKGAFSYMLHDGIFPSDEIMVLFQNFVPKPYFQFGSPDQFVPYLSVVDALFNAGPEKTLDLISSGTERWISWEEMLSEGRTAVTEKGANHEH
jgi:hypothetical protein